MNKRETKYWTFEGGLDVVSPAVGIPPGRLIGGVNFEPWINGGYRRIAGFERYDGRPAPSDATWQRLTLAAAMPTTPAVVVGNTLEGATSGATGVIVAFDTDRMAVYVTKVSGTFQDAEDLDDTTLAESAVATIDGAPADEYAPTIAEEETIGLAAEDEYRDDIQQVPGINDIRGIWQIKDRVYAFRDNVGATACICHKATASGWSSAAMEMAHYVYFTGGSAAPAVGDTLDGASSGATGTIHKIILHTGSWGGADAAGYFVLTSVTGTYSDTENLQVSAATKAVASGASAQFAFPAGGRYSFVSENYYAGSSTYRVYGANGVGPAFEIDENDVVSPILWDLSAEDLPEENKPYLVETFNGRLWLAFPGGSVQHSVVGEPLTWNGFLGAAEYGLGEEVTALTAMSGNVLVARTRRQTHGFYPGASSSYSKKILSDRAGGILYSAEELDTAYAADDSGITSLARVQEFGDFGSATISDLVQPILNAYKEQIVGSMVVRSSNQYRLLYANGEGIIARIKPGGVAEFGRLDYAQNINCSYSCEDENGTPTNWFGGDSGYVYQAERGKNFDGEAIESFGRLPFAHQGSPAYRKRYRLADLELEAERAVTLLMSAELSYAGPETGSYTWDDSVLGGGGFYDLDNWDEIYFDAQAISTARFELTGTGKNISLLFYHSSATTSPFILQGCLMHFDVRRVGR